MRRKKSSIILPTIPTLALDPAFEPVPTPSTRFKLPCGDHIGFQTNPCGEYSESRNAYIPTIEFFIGGEGVEGSCEYSGQLAAPFAKRLAQHLIALANDSIAKFDPKQPVDE